MTHGLSADPYPVPTRPLTRIHSDHKLVLPRAHPICCVHRDFFRASNPFETCITRPTNKGATKQFVFHGLTEIDKLESGSHACNNFPTATSHGAHCGWTRNYIRVAYYFHSAMHWIKPTPIPIPGAHHIGQGKQRGFRAESIYIYIYMDVGRPKIRCRTLLQYYMLGEAGVRATDVV